MTNSPMDPRDESAYGDDVRTRPGYDVPTDGVYDTPTERHGHPGQDQRGAYGAEPIVMRDEPHMIAPRNGAGTAALVLGIIGVLTAVFLIGGLLGLLAIVLGMVALGRVKRNEATNRGSALAGVVLGLLALAITAGVAIAGKNFYDNNRNEVDNFSSCTQAATTNAARAACTEKFQDSVTK